VCQCALWYAAYRKLSVLVTSVHGERADRASRRRSSIDGGRVACVGETCDVSGGLVCRDFDLLEGYKSWALEQPELAVSLPTVKTGRGCHVYFVGNVRRIVHLDDGELRGNGFSVLPPSRHPPGAVYE